MGGSYALETCQSSLGVQGLLHIVAMQFSGDGMLREHLNLHTLISSRYMARRPSITSTEGKGFWGLCSGGSNHPGLKLCFRPEALRVEGRLDFFTLLAFVV